MPLDSTAPAPSAVIDERDNNGLLRFHFECPAGWKYLDDTAPDIVSDYPGRCVPEKTKGAE